MEPCCLCNRARAQRPYTPRSRIKSQAGSYGRWTVNGFDKRSEERAGARQMCSALRGQRRSDERKTPSKSNVRAGRRAASASFLVSLSLAPLLPSRFFDGSVQSVSRRALYCVKSIFESFTCVRFGSSYTVPFTQATRTRRRTEPQRQRCQRAAPARSGAALASRPRVIKRREAYTRSSHQPTVAHAGHTRLGVHLALRELATHASG